MTDPDIVVATGHRELRYPSSVRAGFAQAAVGRRLAVTGGAQGADTQAAWGARDAGIPFEIWFPNRYYQVIYRGCAGLDLQIAAARVRYVIDREDPSDDGAEFFDLTRHWQTEKLWVDNFARNEAMVAVPGSLLVVISHLDPRYLAELPKGGTTHCVRAAIKAGHTRCLWVHDTPDPLVTDVELVAPGPPALFDPATYSQR